MAKAKFNADEKNYFKKLNCLFEDSTPSRPNIDRFFLRYLYGGLPSAGIYPIWRFDCHIAKKSQRIASSEYKLRICLEKLGETAPNLLNNKAIRVRESAKESEVKTVSKTTWATKMIEEWYKRWIGDWKMILRSEKDNKRGRPPLGAPAVMAVILRDHFCERTGAPNYRQVGQWIHLLFPDYVRQLVDSGWTSDRDHQKLGVNICKSGPAQIKVRKNKQLTVCYLEFLKIYQKVMKEIGNKSLLKQI